VTLGSARLPFDARSRRLPVGDCLAVVSVVFVGMLVLHPALGAGFVLVDDHEILSFSPGVRSSLDLRQLPDVVTRILVDDTTGGRFRPLYWVIR
jgi:hypothetical protein